MGLLDSNSPFRPLAKALVKQGLELYDLAKQQIATARQQLNDLVIEARADGDQASGTASASETKVKGKDQKDTDHTG
jgi:hypothetical protein